MVLNKRLFLGLSLTVGILTLIYNFLILGNIHTFLDALFNFVLDFVYTFVFLAVFFVIYPKMLGFDKIIKIIFFSLILGFFFPLLAASQIINTNYFDAHGKFNTIYEPIKLIIELGLQKTIISIVAIFIYTKFLKIKK